LAEALATATKKRDKNYGDTPGHTEIKILPMLAHDFRKREKAIEYPCFLQPKVDGIRCFANLTEDGEIRLSSRSGKDFTQPFEVIRAQLAQFIQGDEIWDGELYSPDMGFEDLCAAVKKGTYRESSENVKFYLFDIFANETECFASRFNNRLIKVAMRLPDRIELVETLIANSREESMEYYARCMENGWEGIMFRNMEGVYKPGHRSKDLQKYKEFIDEEFIITGAKEGAGSDEGTVIWECRTGSRENTLYFDVRPRGVTAQRKQWWNDREKYIGSKLTVRFQNLTSDGIPRFPVGIAIRDYE
jgi:DNA ligase-1